MKAIVSLLILLAVVNCELKDNNKVTNVVRF